jgi:hypothetical protein
MCSVCRILVCVYIIIILVHFAYSISFLVSKEKAINFVVERVNRSKGFRMFSLEELEELLCKDRISSLGGMESIGGLDEIG